MNKSMIMLHKYCLTVEPNNYVTSHNQLLKEQVYG